MRRFFAALLAALMLVSIISMPVSAAETEAKVTVGENEIASGDLNAMIKTALATEGDVKVTLLKDADGTNWDALRWNGYSNECTSLVIDGAGFSIVGLDDMLFTKTYLQVQLEIKNLTIKQADIAYAVPTYEGLGAFIGHADTNGTAGTTYIHLTNCHLVDSSLSGDTFTGGLVGYVASSATDGSLVKIKDCSVKNCKISSDDSNLGGFVGYGAGPQAALVIENGEAVGNTLTMTEDRTGSAQKVGKIIGTIGNGSVTVDVIEHDNTVVSTPVVTTIYGRRGGDTSTLEISGGEYESFPVLAEDLTWIELPANMTIITNSDGNYILGIPAETYQLSATVLDLLPDETTELIVTPLPEGTHAEAYTLVSSDDEVVIVEGNTLTAVGVGEATITLFVNNEPTEITCSVTVKAPVRESFFPFIVTGVTQVKVVDAETEAALQGATFELYRISATGSRKLQGTYTSNATGRITARTLSPRFTYELVMTAAPEGYDLLEVPVVFRVQYNRPLQQVVVLTKTVVEEAPVEEVPAE